MGVPADVLASEILEVVPEVMRTIRKEMRSRRSEGLSVAQFRCLVFIKSYPGTFLSPVAENLGLTLPTVSQMIDGLVANGLVKRVECPTDRRKVELSLTDPGVSSLDIAYQGTQASLASFLDELPSTDQLTVHQAMQALRKVFSPPGIHEATQEGRK